MSSPEEFEGREIAHIEVDSIESRDGALHVTGYFVPPRIVDGDVIDYGPEVTVEGIFIDPTMIFTGEAMDGMAERAARAIEEAGGAERILAKYDGIAVNGMTAEETMAALRKKCGLGEVIEGEIIDPPGYGTSYHYPHCNISACTGCIPQEAVDDYPGLWDHMAPLLAEGFESLLRDFEANAPYPLTHPRGHRATYMTIDEWTGPRVVPVEDEDGAPSTYDLGRLAWMYRHRLTADTLRWSDIQIKGLGNLGT